MTAGVVSARLEAEGIPVRLHSESQGPYRLTVGAMATTEIWVPEEHLQEASVLLTAEDAAGVQVDAAENGSGTRAPTGLMAAVVLGLLGLVAYRILITIF